MLISHSAVRPVGKRLLQSTQANKTSNGPNLCPGFHMHPAISQLLSSNYACFTDSQESENLAQKLLEDKDILAFLS